MIREALGFDAARFLSVPVACVLPTPPDVADVEACRHVELLEARLAEDPKLGESYAHELLHRGTETQAARASSLGGDWEDGDQEQVEEDEEQAEDGEEHFEGGEMDRTDAELADVERQLAELSAESTEV